MGQFNRTPNRFFCRGVNVNSPVDSVPEGYYPILRNVRSYQAGRIEPRTGISRIGTVIAGQTSVHSVRRLNDPVQSTWTRVVGVSTRLATGQATFTQRDTGYSGDPLTLTPVKPHQSIRPWMVVADRSRMRKIRSDGSTLHQVGLPPPANPPTVELTNPPANPFRRLIQDFEATGGLTQGGDAGAPALLNYRVDTTITRILYDTGTTGWAICQPAAITGFQPKMLLNADPGGGAAETVIVHSTSKGSTATTIARIIYDSGSTGACSVHLTIPVKEIARNSLILIAATETVRVTSVNRGPDGVESFRCSTTGTRSAGDAVQALASFRAYFANTQVATNVLRQNAVRTTLTFSTGTGTLSQTNSLDLSTYPSGNRAVRQDDYMHLHLRIDDLSRLVEGKILVDIDASTNDFTENFYTYSFRPSDLVPSFDGTLTLLTAKQRATQREIIDRTLPQEVRDQDPFQGIPEHFIPPEIRDEVRRRQEEFAPQSSSTQTPPGDGQWVHLQVRMRDFLKVGTDESRNWQHMAAIRLSFEVSATVVIDLDSWFIDGSFGPDAGSGLPYTYRYRGRSSVTGARSNFSPSCRGCVSPLRELVTVTLTQHPSAEVDKLDIERFGGSLTGWFYVGTVNNTASPSFFDDQPDVTIAVNPSEGNTHFQPWPIVQTPASGTTTAVAGTTVQDSGTGFDTNWAPGTVILVNGIAHVIYRVISTSLLETVRPAGSQGAVPWEVPEPVLQAQSLPTYWGPFEGHYFACGDTTNPGRLYFTNGHNPDSTSETHFIDITSPSEPLINGCVYNGRGYVFSSERMFALYPTFNETNLFREVEVPNGKGLFARWALAVGPRIWFLAKDGIYETTGGEPTSITDRDLYPLFPHEGIPGVTTNTLVPPDMTATTDLRLNYYDDFLYFDYLDTGAARKTLLYSLDTGGWWPDDYTPGVLVHYGEEGDGVHNLLLGGSDAPDSGLFQSTGTADNAATAIPCQVRTPALDQGDPRLGKFYNDVVVDGNTAGVDVTIEVGFDEHGTTLATVTRSSSARGPLQNIDINSGAGQLGRNISLDLSWSSATARPELYWWSAGAELAPDLLRSWISQPTSHGAGGFHHLRDAYVALISTADVTLTVNIDGTDYTYTIASTGGALRKVYVPFQATKGKVHRYYFTSTADFRLYQRDSTVSVKPWGDGGPYSQVRPFGEMSRVGGPGD